LNNTQGAVETALTVFGGAVPEMAPEDLPEGASPVNQDVDYSPGRVFTRGGTLGQFVFAGLFSEKLTGFVQSLPGTHAPTESAWNSPANAALNIPGTYASVTLNVTGGFQALGTFDTVGETIGNAAGPATIATTPTTPAEVALLFMNCGFNTILGSPGAGWTFLDNPDGLETTLYTQALTTGNLVSASQTVGVPTNWLTKLAFFGAKVPGVAPTIVQRRVIASGSIAPGTYANPFLANTTAGNGILIAIGGGITTNFLTGVSIVDTQGNTYTQIGSLLNSGGLDTALQNTPTLAVFWAPNVPAAACGFSITTVNGGHPGGIEGSITCYEIAGIAGIPATQPFSQVLHSNNFAFNIPTTEGVLGVQAEVSGHQTALTPDAILTAQLVLPNGSLSPKTFAIQLPAADGQSVAGAPNFSWALPLTPALLNNPSFSVNLVATANGGAIVSYSVYAVKLKAWLSPAPASNFNWIKTYEQTDGEIDTLALDANGLLWDEDVDTNPGVLNNISTAIQAGSYAKSVTFDDVEYIGISDLSNGTDVPRLWNGQWLDRVSQVGPGAPPSVTTTASGSVILTITQNPATALPVGPHDFLLVSASPSAHGTFGTPATPGNVMTIITRAAFVPPTSGSPPTPIFKVGTNIQILGFPSINGNTVNNDPTGVSNTAFYTITSVGATVAGQLSYDWITFQVPFTTFYAQMTPGGCTIQSTLSTLTAAQQVPFLEVGNQLSITGAGSAGYDNTFVVAATPNAAQLQITQTSLTTNVANYVFTIITGVAPVIGQFVTVTGTLNGNGIFNVTNAVITSASPTNFSISLVSASNISPAAETGNGIISGTIFQFDPAGTVTNPIIANSVGGLIATSGVMGVGTRQCVCIFQTRNGALTAPSPFVQFNITANAGAIVVSGIPIGPPNVTARILAFTGANGGNFFWIPQPVTVTTNGQQITYSATLINDNITTQVTLSFPDAVLLAGDAIDVQGNNLFEQEELGSSVGFLSYSDRLIAWQEQNKVQNFLNLSFDGGIGVLSSAIQNSTVTYPLGWTVDPVNGGGISLLVSPIFGNSFYVKNVTGGTQAFYGMIEQAAYLDVFQVPIITTNTLYSVRVTARCPSGVVTGNLVMDLFSPKLGTIFGSFTVPLASMSSVMKIFTGTMLTAAFSTVPKDLLFRVYATNIPNNGDVELDRVEPFPTLEPSFQTSFTASYAANPEAFDLVTGHFGPSQNQQPIRGGMVLFDTLYALKTKSWYSTSDNGTTEPNLWTWREVSNKVGTIGSHSFDYGEDYAFTACRAGVYLFTGGEPLKVSQEIAPVWDLINWPAGQSIWVRNDPEQRRLYVGVPIATPNIFMPEFPINTNPQTPNVILMMNYRELNSGMAIADTPPIRSSFSGRLLAPEPARKWSYWNLQSPYADFIDRANNQTPLFVCNGVQNSKVYAFSPSELDDDGQPINGYYVTFGFVKADMQDAKGLGLRRMLLAYLSILAEGNGNLNISVYTQSPQNLPFLLASVPLSQFTLGDLEAAVNLEGDRFFIRVGTNAVGANFQMSKIVASLTKSAWSPIRGTATANA
jgi:hypothetical protein